MQGQANHFCTFPSNFTSHTRLARNENLIVERFCETVRYAPEKIQYGVERYQNETARLYGVIEDHLTGKKDGEKKEYLVGDKYSVADSAFFSFLSLLFS